MSDGIHLFSNGFEFECWTERNCDHCVKDIMTCDLVAALFDDSEIHGLPSGNVTTETAERLGYTDEYIGVLGWPCKERQTDAEPPTPAAHEVRAAGAVMLPGFGDVAVKPVTRGYPS